jgi:hypothetical protein
MFEGRTYWKRGYIHVSHHNSCKSTGECRFWKPKAGGARGCANDRRIKHLAPPSDAGIASTFVKFTPTICYSRHLTHRPSPRWFPISSVETFTIFALSHAMPNVFRTLREHSSRLIHRGKSQLRATLVADGDNPNLSLHLSSADRRPQATSPSVAPDHSAPQGANHPGQPSAIPASGVDNPFLHVIDGDQSTVSPTAAAELRDFAFTTLRTITDALKGPSSIHPGLKVAVEVISSLVAIVDVRPIPHCSEAVNHLRLRQKISQNKSDFEALKRKLEAIMAIVLRYNKDNYIGALGTRVEGLSQYVN